MSISDLITWIKSRNMVIKTHSKMKVQLGRKNTNLEIVFFSSHYTPFQSGNTRHRDCLVGPIYQILHYYVEKKKRVTKNRKKDQEWTSKPKMAQERL